MRIEGERITEKVLNGKFHIKRLVGKPRTGRKDVVQRDTSRILGLQGWWRQAEDREEWRSSSEGHQDPEGVVAP